MVAVAAGEVLSAALFNDKVRRRVARARRTSDSSASTSTTEVAVLRLDDIPLRNGRNYRITWTLNFDVATNADSMRGVLRYTIDGNSPTTASAVLPGSAAEVEITDAAVFEHIHCETDYTPVTGGDEPFSVLLTIRHNQGVSSSIAEADTSTFHTQIYIDDMGDDPGNTGTNL